MFKKLPIAVSLLLSLSANAATVSYNGYNLDTVTNIVTGNDLEWLQWNETVGQSINTALSNYSSDGWRLATNAEMAKLFNDFGLGITFDSDENTSQSVTLYSEAYSHSRANQFIEIFGDTYSAAGFNYDYGDEYEESRALFGGDGDADQLFNTAYIRDEWHTSGGHLIPGSASMVIDDTYPDYSNETWGVSLVRVSPVPVPAASWLFMSALISLAGYKRKNNTKSSN